jgi:hypothetical protein
MLYGDGGAGKTTLELDLGFHLAAGDAWFGIPVARPVRTLLIENEGPRALFRRKMERKSDGWSGSPLEGRLQILAEPWGKFSFADPGWREHIASRMLDLRTELLMAGPLGRLGMDFPGTLAEVNGFMSLIAEVRDRVPALAVLLAHHENRGGRVSGAWEGSGDTLMHVQSAGHGKTLLRFQKARWAETWHKRTLHLAWTDGEGFAVEERPEFSEEEKVESLLAAIRAAGGRAWGMVTKDEGVRGNATELAVIRERLLREGLLFNAGSATAMKLWHRDDPARPDDQIDLLEEEA